MHKAYSIGTLKENLSGAYVLCHVGIFSEPPNKLTSHDVRNVFVLIGSETTAPSYAEARNLAVEYLKRRHPKLWSKYGPAF